ncbi:hypothetical protein EK904_003800 [Melospiza melodia maxima]|nr:hypothetical protein EK904_003800 [Melospiza melodia maxima]
MPRDMAYVFGGAYVPLSCKIIEQVSSPAAGQSRAHPFSPAPFWGTRQGPSRRSASWARREVRAARAGQAPCSVLRLEPAGTGLAALSLSEAPSERAVLHRNRAACYLKLEDYAKAEADATQAIAADGRDVKALFRRSQALQQLGRMDQAVSDLQRCLSLEPRNKAFQEALRALGSSMHEKMKAMACTDSKVEQMFQILLDLEEKDAEKKQKAAQNLIVLAREEAGAEKIFQSDGVRLLMQLLDTAKADLMLAALRTLVGLCSGHRSRTTAILAELGAPRLAAVLGVEHEQVSLAACNLLHVVFDSLKEGLQKDFRGKEDAVVLDSSKDLKLLIKHLLELLVLEGASAHGRDNALNLLIKVVPRRSPKETNNSLSLWVIDQGLKKILEVGSTVCGSSGSLPVTENSRMSTSVLLSKLYEDLKCDAERENFHRLCEDYVRSWFEGHELPGKLRAIQTVSCLLQGPSDAGNRVLELEGIMDSVLSLCASVCEAHQLVAVEALIHAADKAKRASFITANGVNLLKEIYKHSERDSIRIRALVLGSLQLGCAQPRSQAQGALSRWLCNEAIDAGTRRWAVEGLAYLTFDADVKEEFTEESTILQMEKNLRTCVEVLQKQKRDRKQELKALQEQDRALCDILCTALFSIDTGTVPSLDDLDRYRRHVASLNTLKEQRREEFVSNKRQIVLLMEELDHTPDTSFERDVVCEDEEAFCLYAALWARAGAATAM